MTLSTDIENKLLTFINQEILQSPNFTITNQTALISGGLVDSYALVNISLYVEKTFGVEIPENELTIDNFDTVNQITKIVASKL